MFQGESKAKSDAVAKTKSATNASAKASSSETLPVPQKMTMEKPPTSSRNKGNKAGNRVGGAGFKIPDDDDDFSLASLLGEEDNGDTTDKIPFDVAYPKTHVHTPNPIEYAQMKDAMRAAEYERITREKDKRDWSESKRSFLSTKFDSN